MVNYVQCLICGRMTPTDKGICYHCDSPLPTSLDIPPGFCICPNCLRVTASDRGYCRHCRAPIPIITPISHLPIVNTPPSPSEREDENREEEVEENRENEEFIDPRVGPIGNRYYRVGPLKTE